MKKQSIKEIIRYIIAGVTTTLVNLGVYHVLLLVGMDYKYSNLIALICSKIYGYIINKLFVFHSHCSSKKELFMEMGKYIISRGVSGLFDYYGLILMVELIGIDKVVSKYVIQAMVIIINYFIGKTVVFRKRERQNE